MRLKCIITKLLKIAVWALFSAYFVLLVAVILFKYPHHYAIHVLESNMHTPLHTRIVYSNFIPLKGIINDLSLNQGVGGITDNILGNIIAFGPFGFLLPFMFGRIKKIMPVILASAVLSLSFELIQLITDIGSFDVDDIILNTLGAVLGYILYRGFICLVDKILKTKHA